MTFLELIEAAGQKLKAWVLADAPPPVASFAVSDATDVDVTGRDAGDALVWTGVGHEYVATVPEASVLVIVAHGADATVPRPVGVGGVYWVGSVEPANWVAPDLWNDTTGA